MAIYDFNNRLSPNWMVGTAFDPNPSRPAAGTGNRSMPVRPYGSSYSPPPREPGAPSGMSAGMRRLRYGQDPLSQAARSQLPGQQGAGGLGSYTTGITNGTIGQQTINDAMRNFGFSQAPGVPVSQAGGAQINQQFGDLMNQGLGTAGIDFARNAAFTQAQMDLAQQRARADSGIGFGNLLARLHEMQLNGQNAGQNLLMGLIG